jgi:hypothetical protein
MISKEMFCSIKEKHGAYASWAVWVNEVEGRDPVKYDIDNLSVFNLDKNPKLLQDLKPNIVMVGRNFGGNAGLIEPEQLKNVPPLKNFHYPDGYQIDPETGKRKRKPTWDHKLRYAFRGTEFYGAYLTDIVKYYSASYANSSIINSQKKNEESKRIFMEELSDLGCKNPLIIAMGGPAYYKLTELFGNVKYTIVPITHYSFAGKFPITNLPSSKENYRDLVLDQLRNPKKWEDYWGKYGFKN